MKKLTKRTLGKTARMLISAAAFLPVIGDVIGNARDFYDDLKDLALDEAEYNRILEGIRNIKAPESLDEDDASRMKAAIISLLENENMEIENGYMTEAGIKNLKNDLQKAVFEDRPVDSSITDYISTVVEFIGLPFVLKYLMDPEDLGVALQSKVLELDGRVEDLENNPDNVSAGEIVGAINKSADDNKTEIKQEISTVKMGVDELLALIRKRKEPSSQRKKQHDNEYYLKYYKKALFLEDDIDSKVTLATMYVSPLLKGKGESVSNCIMQWFRAKTRKTCMLIFGNAGVGKSSLVSKIIADANQKDGVEREFDLTADQVLAISLRNHCDKIDMNKKAGEILTDLFEGYTIDVLSGKLLILDGLDEICVLLKDFNGHVFLEKMQELEEGFHVLVTSRNAEGYFSNPNDILDLRIETLQWTKREVEQWCINYARAKNEKQNWCNGFLSDYKKLPDYDEKDHRKEAFCVPIILYICGNSEITLSDHSNIGSIYGEAFRKILLRSHLRKQNKQTNLIRADNRSNLIIWQYTKEIAYQMFLHGTLDLVNSKDTENPHALGLKNAKKRTKTVLQEKFGSDFVVSEQDLKIKKELALCPFTRGNEAGGITFVHKTVYEYFTAVKLYEDYFAKFNKSYFGMESEDEAAKDAIKTAIAAFRYREIPDDIFQYLCAMKEAPFSDTAGEGFYAEGFKAAFVRAMENRVLRIIEINPKIDEYFIPYGISNSRHIQIARALQALLCFMTGYGFRNENDSAACKQIRKMLVVAYQTVNLEQWNLQGADLRRADLQEANLQRARLQEANLRLANLEEADLRWARLLRADLFRADLRWAVLKKADLYGAKLQRANLLRAKLQGAKLQKADLQKADLYGAKLFMAVLKKANLQKARLQEANLLRADLQGANLLRAKLQGAELQGANLFMAVLKKANLQKARLQEAKLQRADLEEAKLQRANLEEANLEEANLRRARLLRADLQGARLQGANLQRANLEEAKLRRANLQRANLQRANLPGADLQEANLQGANLQGAKYSTHPNLCTTFPDGFDPKEHGMIEVEYGDPV